MTHETSNDYMDRFMKIGEEIRATEKEIDDLEEIISAVEFCQPSFCIMPSIIQMNAQSIRKHRNVLQEKLNRLNNERAQMKIEITRSMMSEQEDDDRVLEIIDRIVEKLLQIDNLYMEKHNRSSSSIMYLVEDLLTRKKNTLLRKFHE